MRWPRLRFTVRQVTVAVMITVTTADVGCRVSGAQPDRWQKLLSELRAPDLKVRKEAANALVDLALESSRQKRTPAGAEALKKNLKTMAEIGRDKKEDPAVRALLVRAIGIGEFGPVARGIAPALIEILVDETDQEEVRSWCAMILPEIGPPEAVGPAIIAASQSRNTNVKVTASQALGRIGIEPERLIPLLNRAIADPVMQVRVAAVGIASGLVQKDRRALAIVLRATNDKDKVVQQNALMHLQMPGGKASGAKDQLIRLLNDPDPSIRVNSAVALIKITGDGAKYTAIPIEVLGSKASSAREVAALALTLSGPEAKEAVPALKQVLHDSNDKVRVHAAFALANITGQADDFLPSLIEGLASKDLEARIWAAGDLPHVLQGARSAVRLLTRAAMHEDPFVRAIAFSLLGSLEHDHAVTIPLLSGALSDRAAEVRIAALHALAAMGRDAQVAMPQVQKAINDPDENVRQIARRAVRQITGGD